jgi:hypothetical protein
MAGVDDVPPAESVDRLTAQVSFGALPVAAGFFAAERPCSNNDGDGNDVRSSKGKLGRPTSEFMKYFVLEVGGKKMTCKECRRSMLHQCGRYRQHLQACPSFASTYRVGYARLRFTNFEDSHGEGSIRPFGSASDSTHGRSSGSDVRGQGTSTAHPSKITSFYETMT